CSGKTEAIRISESRPCISLLTPHAARQQHLSRSVSHLSRRRRSPSPSVRHLSRRRRSLSVLSPHSQPVISHA
ncbi:hypothetical protein Ancab_024694, partial [Ancistrocladus abbreviatus]